MEFVIADTCNNSLDYSITLNNRQRYLYTNLTFQGEFGKCLFNITSIEECIIWMCECNLEKAITIKTVSNEKLWQVHFPSIEFLSNNSANFLNSNLFSDTVEIMLSLEQSPVLQLSEGNKKSIYLHYLHNYHLDQTRNVLNLFDKLVLADKGAPRYIKMPINQQIARVIYDISGYVMQTAHRPLYIEAKSKELFVLIMEMAEKWQSEMQVLSNPEVEKLTEVKTTLLSNLQKNYSVYELAKIVSMNVFTLKKSFKSFFGKNIHQFVLQARMEKAKNLLLKSDLSIREIAFEVGYKNLSNFSESFKTYYGHPPSQLRRKD